MLILQRETLKYNKEISHKTEIIDNEDGSSKEENSTETKGGTENKVVKTNHSLRLWNCSRLRQKLHLFPKVLISSYFRALRDLFNTLKNTFVF